MRTPEATMRTTPNTIANGKMKSRACESCLKSPAMWFCPADDAFLCHSCDSSVHSANGLAARHNRVPLQTTSFHDDITATPTDQPTWHNGFQKKARTPRHHPKKEEMMKKNKKKMMMMSSVVPEMSGDEDEEENYGEDEENMVFSVPTFDPFDHMDDHEDDISKLFGFGGLMNDHNYVESLLLEGTDEDQLIYCSSTVPSMVTSKETDSDRLEGVDEDQVVYCNSSTTPLITYKETGSDRPISELEEEGEVVKVEVEDGIDHESSTCEDEFDFWALELENEVLMSNNIEVGIKGNKQGEYHEKKEGNYNYLEMEGNSNKKKILLRLNYEDVINSWFGSSPWTTGIRPEFDHLDPNGWPNCMGNVETMDGQYRDERRVHGNGRDDEGREARVLRYREKRRTRLFSKKIRYQVRKLNAEKRPRLKGRFVKRTSSLSQTLPLSPHFPYTINK